MKALDFIEALHGDISKELVIMNGDAGERTEMFRIEIYKKYASRQLKSLLKGYNFNCINVVGNNIEVWVNKA